MRVVSLDVHIEPTDQVFSYYQGEGMWHFNVTLLSRIRKQVPDQFRLMKLIINQAEYDMTMQHRGIEEPKVEALKGRHLREPALGILWDNEKNVTYTLIDGHHRLVRRYRGGLRHIEMWVCLYGIWQHCLIQYNAEEEARIIPTMPPRVDEDCMVTSEVHYKGR